MKIALVAPYFHPVEGGREQTVLFLAEELAGRRHSVSVFTTDRTPKGGKVNSEAESWNFSVHRIKSAFLAFRFELPLEKPSLKEFDLVHIISADDTFTFCFLMGAKLLKKPTLVTIFTPFALLKHPRRILRPFLSFFEFLSIVSMCLADVVQVKNELDLKITKRYAKKVEIIPDGIPDRYFVEKPSINFRVKYGLSNTKIILFVNRIHPLKGPQLLIRALPTILTEYPTSIAVLIGPDPEGYSRELEELAREQSILSYVLLLGFVSEEEKIAAYDAADVVVIPSIGEFTEAFSIVLSEAWARGKTVVVTPSRALRSRVTPGTGYIADYSPESLAKSILTALENPTRPPKVYSWSDVVDEYEKLYREILSSPKILTRVK